MVRNSTRSLLTVGYLCLAATSAYAQEHAHPTTTQPESEPQHTEHERATDKPQESETHVPDDPPLPEGMTLDEVLDYADRLPPSHFPGPVPDNELRIFTLVEQLEYRFADDGRDELGWEAQGWIGFDYDRFVWKSEGESIFDGGDAGESETDLLYSRLITPFWSAQIGVQYANEWEPGDYSDRWSGVLALQGLAPGMVELDTSLYISDRADVTATIEAEYNLRLTQRLVLQPRTELGLAFQDVPDRMLGAGLTDLNLDLRLRYEIDRQFAPYVGVRYTTLLGESANIAERAGDDSDDLLFLIGVRFAF